MDGDSNRARRKRMESMREWRGEVQHVFEGIGIKFGVNDLVNIQRPQTNGLVIKAEIGGYNVERVFINAGNSVDVIFWDCFRRLGLKSMVDPVETSLFGFAGESVRVTGRVKLQLTLGEGRLRQLRTINFMLVDAPSQYNVMLGRLAINAYTAIISISHLMINFQVEDEKERIIGVGVAGGDQQV